MDVQSTQAALRSSGESIATADQRGTPQAGGELGKNDFLQLLMTQMTHQDPLDPMDSKGMMQQFAQMGTMEQLTNISDQMGTLNDVQQAVARSNAYSYLDKDVRVAGGETAVRQGQVPTMRYSLPRDANVRVRINDSENAPVRTMELGYRAAGDHRIEWNGRNDNGDPVPDGHYSIHVKASTDDGSEVPAQVTTQGRVSGVRFKDGKAYLRMNGQEYSASDVVGLSNRSQRMFDQRDPKGLRNEMTPKPPVSQEPR